MSYDGSAELSWQVALLHFYTATVVLLCKLTTMYKANISTYAEGGTYLYSHYIYCIILLTRLNTRTCHSQTASLKPFQLAMGIFEWLAQGWTNPRSQTENMSYMFL